MEKEIIIGIEYEIKIIFMEKKDDCISFEKKILNYLIGTFDCYSGFYNEDGHIFNSNCFFRKR